MVADREFIEEDNGLMTADYTSDPRPNGHRQSMPADVEEGMEPFPEMDLLTSHISNQWSINKDDRVRVEQEMMRLQEAVNGEYDPNTISAIKAQGGSEIFVPLTSMQCNAGSSWLLSVLNPPGDKAFTLKAKPVPTLPESIKQKIKGDVKSKIKQTAPKVKGSQSNKNPEGLPAGPTGEPVRPVEVNKIADNEERGLLKRLKKESVTRAENMEGLIQSQLLDSGWYKTLEDFITDLVVLPSAFIKTTYEYKTKMATTVINGKFTMEVIEELVAKDERVSAFDMYPSPDQTDVHNGSMIERLKMSRSEIHNCLDKPGYDNDNILSVLEEVGGSGFAAWQSNVDSSRRYSENHSTDFSGQDGAIYGLRFLGPVSVEKLLDWGYSVGALKKQGFLTEKIKNGKPSPRDMFREIDIDAILIGNHVIKVAPNMDPEGKRPYYKASYRNIPGSFWGKSVAMLAQPHQRLINATARALSNNMGVASGPQIVVYTDRLPNGESIQSIRPLKIWQMTSDPSGSNAKPIEFFQPQSNAKELMAVYQYYTDTVGDVTGIPKASYSSDQSRMQPGAQTASGMALMLETASKQIKQAVRNIDSNVIEPRIQYQFRTNMMDPEVGNQYKGDMTVQAIGAKSIVAKAVENQRAVELLQATANPIDMEVLGKEGRAALLRSVIRSYDMTDIVPSEEDIERKVQEESANQQQQPPSAEEVKLQIEQMRSKTRIKDQEMENSNAEAQRRLDLQLGQMDLEKKKIDAQIAVTNNTANNDAKMKQIALKESNNNARFQSEVALKQAGGTGV